MPTKKRNRVSNVLREAVPSTNGHSRPVINHATAASVYNAEQHTDVSRPPWLDSNKETQDVDDPLGLRLNAFKQGSSREIPIRAIVNGMSNAKTAAEMKRWNSELQTLNRQMTNNMLMTRATWMFEQMLDPRGRDLYRECGYPLAISPQMYRQMYDRDGITRRLVELWPKECWEVAPDVYEDEDEDNVTDFEKGWQTLCERHAMISYLERADILSGIGSFGILILGMDDGKPLNEPADGLDVNTGQPTWMDEDGKVKPFQKIPKRKLLYMRAFDESQIHVGRWNTDQTSPRYAQPDMYLVRFLDYSTVPIGQTVTDAVTHMVHWSRVVHFADNRKSSEVFGVPRAQHSFNRLLDLRKLFGGLAEMCWKGGFPGIGLEVLPELADAEIDQNTTREQMEQYFNGLRRYFAVAGMTIKTLTPNVLENPANYIDVQLQAICIDIGCPMRVFKGVEQAVKAGQQDADAWDVRLQRRKTNYLTHHVVMPVINRCVALGLIPAPKKQPKVHWPQSSSPTDQEKAQRLTAFANAIAAYMNSGGDQLMTPSDFLIQLGGLDSRVVAQIMENVQEYQTEQAEQQAQQQQAAMPDANTLAQAVGIDPQDAQTILDALGQLMQQQQGQQQGQPQAGGGPATPASPEEQSTDYAPPSGKNNEPGSGPGTSAGIAGGSGVGGSSGGGPSGGQPWRV